MASQFASKSIGSSEARLRTPRAVPSDPRRGRQRGSARGQMQKISAAE